jgi:hypothetical protein
MFFSHDPNLTDLVFLPEDLASVDQLMDVTPIADSVDALRAVEEQPNDHRTLRAKLTTMYNAPYAVAVDSVLADNEPGADGEGDKEEQLIRAKIKVCSRLDDFVLSPVCDRELLCR